QLPATILQIFTRHSWSANLMHTVALSGDGKRVLTGSWDQTALLWDAGSGKPLQIFTGHSGNVTCAVFGPNDGFVATSSVDGTVRIWKLGRDQPLFSF